MHQNITLLLYIFCTKMIFRFNLSFSIITIILFVLLLLSMTTCQSFQLFDSSLLSSASTSPFSVVRYHHHRYQQLNTRIMMIPTTKTTTDNNVLVHANSYINNNNNKNPTTITSLSNKNKFGWSNQYPYQPFIFHILFMFTILLGSPVIVPTITTTSSTVANAATISSFITSSSSMLLLSSTIISSSSSSVLKSQQDIDSIVKLQKGYEQLNYLLDHWVEETTICGRSGDNPYISKNGCERTPIKVMDYLGYKSINHPLYKVDKTIRTLDKYIIDDNDSITYYDALEVYMIAAEEGNSMAYISSWGEANPGGGKDRVELFIERAKQNVVQARDSLGTIINILVE